MLTCATFVCDCGTRLQVFTEGTKAAILPCPNRDCKTRHLVSGQIHEAQIERDGKWIPYDWKVRGAATAE